MASISDQRFRFKGRITILLLWLISAAAILIILSFPGEVTHSAHTLQSMNQDTVLYATAGRADSPQPPGQGAKPGVSTAFPVTGMRSKHQVPTEKDLQFPTKVAFLNYFEEQYSTEELLQAYEASVGANKTRVSSITVSNLAAGKKNLKRFNEKYKVSVRFDIKPVPQ